MENDQEIINKIKEFGQRAVEQWAEEKVTALTPERADNYLSVLSGYSALLEEEFGKLEMDEPIWQGSQDQNFPQAKLDRLWNSTPSGQRMIQLKHRLRAVDKIINACKRRLKRFEMQAYNQV
jgi:hypothetical protein